MVLALITIFLFREGFGFFGQNSRNLRLYRQAGLEYVDIIRSQADGHAALSRRSTAPTHGMHYEAALNLRCELLDQFADEFSDAGTTN